MIGILITNGNAQELGEEEKYCLTLEEQEELVKFIDEFEEMRIENEYLEELVETYEENLEKERELHDEYVENLYSEISLLEGQLEIKEDMVLTLEEDNAELRDSLDNLTTDYTNLEEAYDEKIELLNEQIEDYKLLADQKSDRINELQFSNWLQNGGFLLGGVMIGALAF